MNQIRSNLHTHTVLSDGSATADQMVQAAIDKGFVSLGFSDHGHASYDSDCCMTRENVELYLREIPRLRERYKGKIQIYIGVESEYYEPTPRQGLDYVIGSCHYVRDDSSGAYYCIEHRIKDFERAVRLVGDGDIRRLVARYYENMADIAHRLKPDILGHISLITKLNGNGKYFDTQSGWYRDLCRGLAREVARSGCIVEVNTGTVFKGYTKQQIPDESLLRELCELGVPVTVSSDAHCPEAIDFQFTEMARLLWDTGYRSTKQLIDGRFQDMLLA